MTSWINAFKIFIIAITTDSPPPPVVIYISNKMVIQWMYSKYLRTYLQIININDIGGEIGLLLLGEFIDNDIVKFA